MNKVGILPLQYCKPGMRIGRDITVNENVIVHYSSEITSPLLDDFFKNNISEVPILLTGHAQMIYDDYKIGKSYEQCMTEYELDYKKMIHELKDIFINCNFTYDKISAFTEFLTANLEKINNDSIFSCVDGIRDVDEYLYTHSINVAMLAWLMGSWIDLSEQDKYDLVMAGILHDIGKTKIDKKIMMKSTAFDAPEICIIKKHPHYGYEILNSIPEMKAEIKDAVYSHHEKINGSGYPRGLQGDEISKKARILAICDIYDAMMANKVYRPRQSSFHVFDVFMNDKLNRNLDYDLVTLFLNKISGKFMGKNVRLSNNLLGKIIFMNPIDYSRPVVQLDNEIIDTSASNTFIVDIIDTVTELQ